MLAGVGPLAWRTQSGLLTATVLAAIYFLSIVTLTEYGGEAHALTSTFASAALLAGEKLLRWPDGTRTPGAGRWCFFGFAGFLF